MSRCITRIITAISVPNYKSFQESQRVKPSQSLTKIIKRNIKIYDIKYVHYKNIASKKSKILNWYHKYYSLVI